MQRTEALLVVPPAEPPSDGTTTDGAVPVADDRSVATTARGVTT